MSVSAYFDTSALAKWYLPERRSDDVEEYLRSVDQVWISDLTRVEMRSLLRRRRLETHLDAVDETRVYAAFRSHISDGYLNLLETTTDVHEDAIGILERTRNLPLRSLDALHLAAARMRGTDCFATADARQRDVAETLAFEVQFFG